ncbi:MAG TPA: large conductance mechanosensitive channel protein MscL [Capsulimonadaceae bacterium]|jgi:large conductance mechanosensitive channel
MSAIKEFKEFVLRGNVVDLAVGVVIGGAFGGVVTAFVKDLIMPLIGIAGKMSFADWSFSINGSKFPIGDLVNTIVSFLIVAGVVFFMVVKPLNVLMSLRKTETPPEAETRECPECLSKVPAKASRCAFCTAQIPAA